MSDISSKWGMKVAKRGFAQIPNYLLQINMFVHEDHQLSATEMVILIHLIASWWKKDEMPFPSMRTLSERSGISERQVQRAIKGLEKKGYLRKTKKKIKNVISSNVYDLRPMVGILQTVAGHYINKHPRNIKVFTEAQTLPSEKAPKEEDTNELDPLYGKRDPFEDPGDFHDEFGPPPDREG